MRKIIYLLIISCSLFAYTDGSIEFVNHGDSLTIQHIAAWRNCASRYRIDLEIIDTTIYLMEVDTVGEAANCMCYFDLATTITIPPPGQYHLIIQTTNFVNGDTALVADTSITVGNIGLISYSNPGCMTNSKQETGSEIPLINQYESECQASPNSSLYTYSYNDRVNITWYTDSVNTNILPKWNAILSDDTLHLTMIDTGAVDDSVCSKYITALFGPMPPGKFVLNFLNGELGYPTFIVDQQVILTVENSDLILNWDVAELNCCLETLWDGWLVGDTFHVTMTDTGAPCDCICPFELSARFGPFKPGSYVLDFHNTFLGLFEFTINGAEKTQTALTALSMYQSECYDAVAIDTKTEIAEQFALLFCYPNPFNPIVNIKYFIPEDNDISIQIFDINGRQQQTLFRGQQEPGSYSIQWNAVRFSSGIYFVVLQGENLEIRKKVLLLK